MQGGKKSIKCPGSQSSWPAVEVFLGGGREATGGRWAVFVIHKLCWQILDIIWRIVSITSSPGLQRTNRNHLSGFVGVGWGGVVVLPWAAGGEWRPGQSFCCCQPRPWHWQLKVFVLQRSSKVMVRQAGWVIPCRLWLGSCCFSVVNIQRKNRNLSGQFLVLFVRIISEKPHSRF